MKKSQLAFSLCLVAVGLISAAPNAAAEEACTLRRGVYYESACSGQLTTYVWEQINCDGNIHYHLHKVASEGTCPIYAE
ncbi:MAG TPA: hypothetical protein VF789_10880 [Thermoanaerobaculia bacterium]